MANSKNWPDRSLTLLDEARPSTHCGDDPRLASKETPKSSTGDVVTCPDGGAKAWLTVFGAFIALFCSFGQLNSVGTFQTYYAENQLRDLPASTISWIGSLQLWIFFFSGGFIGRLFDLFGPRVVMIPGTIILIFSTMMTSLATKYYQIILAQGVLFGLGVGMLFYPPLTAVSTHFSKRRGTANGIAIAGSGAGGVVYPIMYQQLFTRVGFAWGVRISGFISLACCIVAICTVTSLRPAGGKSAPWLDRNILHDVPYMLLLAGGFLVNFGLFIPFIYIADYAESKGYSAKTGFYIISAMNGGGIIGRFLPPLLSDIFGRFNVFVPCSFLLGLIPLVLWIFAQRLVAILLFAILYGFLSGAFIAMILPCVAQISDIKEIGTRVGILYSVVSFASLAGGPAAGAILKAERGSYTGMMALCGAASIAGSLFFLWARVRMDPRVLARV